jgi:hypothetical protein
MAQASRGTQLVASFITAVVDIHGWKIKALQCNRKRREGQKLFFSGRDGEKTSKSTLLKGLRGESGDPGKSVKRRAAQKSLTSAVAPI